MEGDLKEFFARKGIDAENFRGAMPTLFLDFEREFRLGGAVAMELRKKFLWNDLRIMFPKQGVVN
jgi:hypothetical protein